MKFWIRYFLLRIFYDNWVESGGGGDSLGIIISKEFRNFCTRNVIYQSAMRAMNKWIEDSDSI
jgi:hypothetical protein